MTMRDFSVFASSDASVCVWMKRQAPTAPLR